ncbi:MAG: DUF1326 domain-containing protein [Proteobacteria bacterium]|nr:DUF1326 domain-containing protein [Pseudomonadota bacterium]
MPFVDWEIKAREFANCNCAYGCPCQFNALPTDGTCRAAVGYRIDQGHFKDIRLDGLRAAGLYSWPGAVHQGNGTMQLIVDCGASDAQHEALLTIMQGHETEPMATMWSVYTTMCSTILDPLSAPIDFEVDVDARTARLSIPGVVESTGEPIRSPVNGAVHRARIDLPHGFEYSLAEIGSGTTKATGEIKLDFEPSYGQFAHIHLIPTGPVRN